MTDAAPTNPSLAAPAKDGGGASAILVVPEGAIHPRTGGGADLGQVPQALDGSVK
jgi:hypothetical protein